LKLSLSAAADKYILRGKRWETPWYLYFWDKVSYEADGVTPKLSRNLRSTFTDPRLTQREEHQLNINLTALLSYDKKIGVHTFNFLAGITKETVEGDNFNGFRRYFISSSVDQLFAGGTDEQNTTNVIAPNVPFGNRSRLSYFGRAAYNYKERYLAEFVWRYDGSYMFPDAGRFGFFPGILVGWNISEEKFFKNVSFINYLKLRGSYGQMGNDQVFYNGNLQEYAYLSTYKFGSYIIDDKVQKTLFESRVPNQNFTWEVANNSNIGLEGAILGGKVNFELEVFNNIRTKILIQLQGRTPASSGIDQLLPPQNLGKVKNKGWEFKVGYNGQVGDLRFNVGANGGYAQSKIVFWDEVAGVPEWQQSTGKPIGSNFVAYQYDGVFLDAGEISRNTLNYSAATPSLQPGDMKFKDVNGDGKITTDDRVRLKKGQDPTFTYGVTLNASYKNFDLSVLFQGATGGLLFIGTESGDIGNYLEWSYKHRWTVDKPSSVDPRLANRGGTYYAGGPFGSNTYWLRSSDYLRLKNVEIGYNLPNKWGSKAGVNSLRIYANGINLITWDKMKIWDPESTRSDGQYYPQARIISLGARLSF